MAPPESPRTDSLLWPVDRDLLLGFAPAGLSTAGMLLATWLLDRGCPDGHARIVAAIFVGHAVLWLLFAPIYLFGWVHQHPRRAVAETGAFGSVALAALMWLLNILVYAALMAAFGWGSRVPWDLVL